MKTKFPYCGSLTGAHAEIDISDLAQLNEETIRALHDSSRNSLVRIRNPLALASLLVKAAKGLEHETLYEPAYEALTTALRLRIRERAHQELIASTYYRLSELSCKREDFSMAIRYARLAKSHLDAGTQTL